MRCPFCTEDEDRVIDSRQSKDSREIRRRRECVSCNRRFTTYERVEEALPMVVKGDGRREPFDRNKVLKGIRYAAAKRAVATEDLSNLALSVEREISELGRDEIDAGEIGNRVLPRLRELDEVAYVRFASIYRDFRDVEEFLRELGDIVRARPHTSGDHNSSDRIE